MVLGNIKYAYEYRKNNNLDYKLYMFSIITRFNKADEEKIRKLYEQYVDEVLMAYVIASPYVKGVKEYLCLKDDKSIINVAAHEKLPCMQLFDRIVVNEDGYLCACCNDTRNGLTEIEDLHRVKLEDALYGEKMVAIRKMHIDKNIKGTVCENCIYERNDAVLPLAQLEGKNMVHIDEVDVSEEIRKRFLIEE